MTRVTPGVTPGVTRVTPGVTPGVTRVTPGVTRVTVGVTRVTPGVTPGVTRVTPGVTRVTPGMTRVTPGAPPRGRARSTRVRDAAVSSRSSMDGSAPPEAEGDAYAAEPPPAAAPGPAPSREMTSMHRASHSGEGGAAFGAPRSELGDSAPSAPPMGEPSLALDRLSHGHDDPAALLRARSEAGGGEPDFRLAPPTAATALGAWPAPAAVASDLTGVSSEPPPVTPSLVPRGAGPTPMGSLPAAPLPEPAVAAVGAPAAVQPAGAASRPPADSVLSRQVSAAAWLPQWGLGAGLSGCGVRRGLVRGSGLGPAQRGRWLVPADHLRCTWCCTASRLKLVALFMFRQVEMTSADPLGAMGAGRQAAALGSGGGGLPALASPGHVAGGGRRSRRAMVAPGDAAPTGEGGVVSAAAVAAAEGGPGSNGDVWDEGEEVWHSAPAPAAAAVAAEGVRGPPAGARDAAQRASENDHAD